LTTTIDGNNATAAAAADESTIVRDLLYTFQGVDAATVRFERSTRAFVIDANASITKVIPTRVCGFCEYVVCMCVERSLHVRSHCNSVRLDARFVALTHSCDAKKTAER
jgi:hypothetical protein